MTYYLAIDIGASSGRHILGHIENDKLILEEVYRFENNLVEKNGSLIWDIDGLFEKIKNGIKECKKAGKIPATIAIETWGVDYVLLDENQNEILPAFCYRDERTKYTIPKVDELISDRELYNITGIQKLGINTIYQLYADKLSGKLDNAKYYLMMPEYLSYKLTGEIKNEYTISSTTGMLNAKEKTWDKHLIELLGLPEHLFGKLNTPSTVIGDLTPELQKEFGFNSTVVFAPSHDTASAVTACPMEENDLYISSGTWSLMGMESLDPIISEKSFKANFTNEGGIDYRFRFLKNYMGMWLFQNIRRNINKSMTYDEMMELAMNCEKYRYFDVNDDSIVAPSNMIEAIKTLIGEPDADLALVLSSVYHSLALSYKKAVDEIESITGKTINTIHIVGGGCQDKYLNRLTKEYTSKPVTYGPIEATAAGNIISQVIFDKNITLEEARQLVKTSFDIKEII